MLIMRKKQKNYVFLPLLKNDVYCISTNDQLYKLCDHLLELLNEIYGFDKISDIQ